ncbi:DUF4386 family protein [Aquicella lusitana]|uniref:Uncharacterized protein DUF4386 n=1 Tax=Aquicella lusitana TaxID=254246 RepID=A0A370GSZ0_9COXI|nr:DUF4386 family protein [Aquicella lusitana]RDI46579.1 uncharacterized protein DUF4386 [Aquicella lusitana]VVC74243.1 hypothetical protein AQULUS_20080 [Aquicella lusitana]
MAYTRHEAAAHETMIIVGGWSMVIFAILFVGITLLIDNLAQAQTMLYGMEQHNLFKVAAGSETIRTLLVIYALLPLLLIPGSVGTFYAFIEPHEANMRCGMYFATAGALALTISLMMLPSINWHLVTYIQAKTGESQSNLIIMLQSLHSYLGVFVGDLVGFGCLLIWFFITSFVMLRTTVMPHAVGVIQLIIAIIATLILALRYSGLIPDVHINVQAPGIIALWIFITGIGLISLRK